MDLDDLCFLLLSLAAKARRYVLLGLLQQGCKVGWGEVSARWGGVATGGDRRLLVAPWVAEAGWQEGNVPQRYARARCHQHKLLCMLSAAPSPPAPPPSLNPDRLPQTHQPGLVGSPQETAAGKAAAARAQPWLVAALRAGPCAVRLQRPAALARQVIFVLQRLALPVAARGAGRDAAARRRRAAAAAAALAARG